MEQFNAPPTLNQVTEDLSQPLLRYLGRYTGDPDLAQDLLQETLIRIAHGVQKMKSATCYGMRPPDQVHTWDP